jgi:hypothetical protein
VTAQAGRNVVAVVAIATVAAAVAFGLVRLGPPSDERSRMLDERRLDDLRLLARSVDLHWTRDGRLPDSLTVLSDSSTQGASLSDPATDEPYLYRVLTESTFELCGRFETDWVRPDADPFWSHPPGRHCFELQVREVRRQRDRDSASQELTETGREH